MTSSHRRKQLLVVEEDDLLHHYFTRNSLKIANSKENRSDQSRYGCQLNDQLPQLSFNSSQDTSSDLIICSGSDSKTESCSNESITKSRGRPRKIKVTDDEYDKRRMRNNEAVKRSREKSKQLYLEKKIRVDLLQKRHDHLLDEMRKLTETVKVLEDLARLAQEQHDKLNRNNK